MKSRVPAAAIAAVLLGSALAAPAAQADPSTTIVISKIMTRGPAGGNDEFIELKNKSTASVAIGGWQLWGSNVDRLGSGRARDDHGGDESGRWRDLSPDEQPGQSDRWQPDLCGRASPTTAACSCARVPPRPRSSTPSAASLLTGRRRRSARAWAEPRARVPDGPTATTPSSARPAAPRTPTTTTRTSSARTPARRRAARRTPTASRRSPTSRRSAAPPTRSAWARPTSRSAASSRASTISTARTSTTSSAPTRASGSSRPRVTRARRPRARSSSPACGAMRPARQR